MKGKLNPFAIIFSRISIFFEPKNIKIGERSEKIELSETFKLNFQKSKLTQNPTDDLLVSSDFNVTRKVHNQVEEKKSSQKHYHWLHHYNCVASLFQVDVVQRSEYPENCRQNSKIKFWRISSNRKTQNLLTTKTEISCLNPFQL